MALKSARDELIFTIFQNWKLRKQKSIGDQAEVAPIITGIDDLDKDVEALIDFCNAGDFSNLTRKVASLQTDCKDDFLLGLFKTESIKAEGIQIDFAAFSEVISSIRPINRTNILDLFEYDSLKDLISLEPGTESIIKKDRDLELCLEIIEKYSEKILVEFKEANRSGFTEKLFISFDLLNKIVDKLEVDKLDCKMLDLMVYSIKEYTGRELGGYDNFKGFLKKVALSPEKYESMESTSKNFLSVLLRQNCEDVYTITLGLHKRLKIINKIDVKNQESAVKFMQQYDAAELKKILEDEDLKILLKKYFGEYLCFNKYLAKNLDPDKYKSLLDFENIKDISIDFITANGSRIAYVLKEQPVYGEDTYAQNLKKLCVDLKGVLTNKIETAAELAQFLRTCSLNDNKKLLIDALKGQGVLSGKIQNAAELARVLGACASDKNKKLVIDALKAKLPNIITDADELVHVLYACGSEENKNLVIDALKGQGVLSGKIQNAVELARVLYACGSEANKNLAIEALKEQGVLSVKIQNAAELAIVLYACGSEANKNLAIEALKEQGVLSVKIQNAAELARVLYACGSEANKNQVIGGLKVKLPEIITDAENLVEALGACGSDENKNQVIGGLKVKLPEIITDAVDVIYTLGACDSDEHKNQIIGALKAKLPQIITDAEKLIEVLDACGSSESKEQVIEFLTAKGVLSGKIQNAAELARVLGACASDKNKKQVIEALKEKGVLSGIIQNAAELARVLGACASDKNKKQVIEALKEKGVLSGIIQNAAELAKVLGACGSDENKNHVIASLSSDVINSIFRNMHDDFVAQRRPSFSHNNQDMLNFSRVVAKYIFLKKGINYADEPSINVLAKLLFVNISYEGARAPSLVRLPDVGINVLPVVSEAIVNSNTMDFKLAIRTSIQSRRGTFKRCSRVPAKRQAYQYVMRVLADEDAGGAAAAASSL